MKNAFCILPRKDADITYRSHRPCAELASPCFTLSVRFLSPCRKLLRQGGLFYFQIGYEILDSPAHFTFELLGPLRALHLTNYGIAILIHALP